MSNIYPKEIFNDGNIRLMLNIRKIEEGCPIEDITVSFYAINNHGIPIFTEDIKASHLVVASNEIKKITRTVDSRPDVVRDKQFLVNNLESNDLDTLLNVFEKFKSEDKVKGLLSSLSDLEIENLHGAYYHKRVGIEIQNLEKLIELAVNDKIDRLNTFNDLIKYQAKQKEKIFQNWIEANLWVFGVEYIKKHDVRKISLFSEGDILMESLDGYLDLIELKRPKHKLLVYDTSHHCYYPHSDLSKVIGQSLHYLKKLDEYKLNLEKEYKLRIIKPRIKIIIGRNFDFDDEQKDCLRILNSSLNSVQIITFDDLVSFGKQLLKSTEMD